MSLTVNDVIAHSLTTSRNLTERYVADLSPAEFLHRPTPKSNCAAWLLGHVTLVDRRVLGLLGVSDLPELPAGYEKQFSRDEGCPEAHGFGDVAVLLPLFLEHRNRLIEAVRKADAAVLNKPLEKPNPRASNVGEMANFQAQHTTMHAGQITIIRRSLGRPPLI